MKTPHSCHDFGPTLDTELNVNKYVRMLNDIDTQQDSQSWASLTSISYENKLKSLHVRVCKFPNSAASLSYGLLWVPFKRALKYRK